MIAVLGAEVVIAGGRPSALDVGADSTLPGQPDPCLATTRCSSRSGLTEEALAAAMPPRSRSGVAGGRRSRLRKRFGPELAAAAVTQVCCAGGRAAKFGAAAAELFFTRDGPGAGQPARGRRPPRRPDAGRRRSAGGRSRLRHRHRRHGVRSGRVWRWSRWIATGDRRGGRGEPRRAGRRRPSSADRLTPSELWPDSWPTSGRRGVLRPGPAHRPRPLVAGRGPQPGLVLRHAAARRRAAAGRGQARSRAAARRHPGRRSRRNG